MAQIKLIGLTGAIGAGKSTVANILYGSYGFTELTFKNAMVHCLAHIFEVDGQIFYDRELKEQPHAALFDRSPREVMQSFGTDWGRKMVHSDIWLRRVENKLVHFPRCVVSDVRFLNEAEMIKFNNGLIFHIKRKNNPFAVATKHESEYGLLGGLIDGVIDNDGDLDGLRAAVADLLGVGGSHE